MIVIDEYLATRFIRGDGPAALEDEDLALPASHHWRLLQALHGGRGGQLSRMLSELSPAGQDSVLYPHPEVLAILDTRPLLNEAARITARYGGGWLVGETLAAGLAHGHQLYFGSETNVGRVIRTAASDLGIEINVVA